MKASKPAILVLIGIFITTLIAADENGKEPKRLPEHLIKLENELIIEVGKAEELIYRRGALYENEDVTAYINKIGTKIARDADSDGNVKFNFRIIRDPMVNAFAMPNGSIYIHTGALARLEDEAQLSLLLAHEISHVTNKDGVYHTHSSRNKTVTFKLVDIVLAPTSVFFGLLGDLVQLGFGLLHASTITGYGRNIEARADKDGILWAAEHGYDPNRAAGLIEIFLKEKERYKTGPEIYFLMDHPTNEWRLKKMKKLILKKYGETAGGEIREEEFLTNMTEVKLYNATLNMKMDRLEHANDNIRWVLDKFPKNPEAHYLAGEICRLKAEDKNKLKYELNIEAWKELNKGYKKGGLEEIWLEEGGEEYGLALAGAQNYADSHKGLGLIYHAKGDKDKALSHFGAYLELNKDAQDKRYIESLIKRINKSEKEEKDT